MRALVAAGSDVNAIVEEGRDSKICTGSTQELLLE
jgi:hypothetical protein